MPPVRLLCAGLLAGSLILAAASSGKGGGGERLAVLDGTGNLYEVSVGSGKVKPISKGDLFGGDDFGVARERNGNYVVIARRGEGSPNADPSRVIRVNGKTGKQSLIAAPSEFTYGVIAVAVSPKNGDIYVADEFAPDPDYLDGGIYRVDPKSGAIRLVSNNSRSDKAGGAHHMDGPLGLAFDRKGTLWAVDDIAGDESRDDDFMGAVLKIDTRSGKQTLFSSNATSAKKGGKALFNDPRALAIAPNGDFYVVDNPGINNPDFDGDDAEVIKVDAKTGKRSLVSDNARSQQAGGKALFRYPYGIHVLGDGDLAVTDGDRLLRVDPKTGKQSIAATGLGNSLAIAPR